MTSFFMPTKEAVHVSAVASGVYRAEAMREVARWLEVVYNRRQLHSVLGMVPPVKFEEEFRAEHSAGRVQEEASTQAA